MKFVELVAVPSGFVTAIGPVVAPDGTVAVIFCGLSIVNVADVPLKVTLVTSGPLKLLPWIATEVPTGPLVGENERDRRRRGERGIGAGDGDRECDKQDDQGGLGSATSHPHHDASLAVRKMHGSLVSHSHRGLVYPP